MSVQNLLESRIAYISGGGRNIGEGIANRFAEQGATVVLNDIDAARANAAVNSLPTEQGQSHLAQIGDMTNPEAVKEAAEIVEERYGGLDILVNNLGYAVNKGVFDTEIEEWYQVLDLTLTSGFLCTKYLGELLIESDTGAIINLASRLGWYGAKDKIAYCTAKGGVVNMTRQLALDFADHGVRVNSISPGLVGDPVGMTSGRSEGFDTSRIPLNRIGNPRDIGNAALYLASDLADYVTGADLAVDGGSGA